MVFPARQWSGRFLLKRSQTSKSKYMLKELFHQYPELCVIGILFIALFALALKWYFQETADEHRRYYPPVTNDVLNDIVKDENNFPM